MAVDASGNILVGDEQNTRIRFVGTPVAPASVSPPTVAGTAQQGRGLTATTGGWSGTGPTFAYRWRRCDGAGGNCLDIAGAAAKAYALTAADVDVGSTIRMHVTATNAAGSATASSAQTAVVAATILPPQNTSAPTISGLAKDGQTLTADPGTWSGGPPLTFGYQWRRCDSLGANCGAIGGATAQTYVLGSADVAATIRVRVTASNGAASSAYTSSVLAHSPLSYWRFDETAGPLLDVQGFMNGAYINVPTRGVAGLIAGDDDTAVSLDGSSQYLDVPANAAWTSTSFSIEVVVKPSVLPANKTIWSTIGPGFAGWWLNTGPNGSVRLFVGNGSTWMFGSDGPVLDPGVAHDIAATYDGTNSRLYVDGSLVSTSSSGTMAQNVGGNVMRFGAYSTGPGQYWPGVIDDASFYPSVLTPAQIGEHADAFANGSTATSAASAVVTGLAPVNSVLPSISGAAREGQTLSADPGTWSGSAPIGYAYQWRRCDGSGGGCVDIAGAVQQAYLVAGGDVNSTLRVVVTGSNVAGSSSATSAQSGVVAAAPSGGTLTFTLAAGGDDGDVDRTAASYPPGGATDVYVTGNVFTAGRRLAFGNFQVFDGLLRFDTSGLPDNATVTGATLKVWVNAKADGNNRNLTGEWYDAALWPIDAADYTLNPGTNALAGADVTAITAGATNSFALQNLGSVSKTGFSGLRLGIEGGQPSGDNYVQFASLEGGKPAQLTVTYTSGPATPPVNSVLPSISGAAQEGQTLSADPGTWTGTMPIGYAYQWRRCDGSGGGCVNIVGASSQTYLVASGDVGLTLRVVVTGSNVAGSAAATSAQTAVVTAAAPGGTVTFTLAAGGDDGDVSVRAQSYPPSANPDANSTGKTMTAGRRFASSRYQVFDGLLRFDTASLPDSATVTGVTLKLWVNAKADGNNRNLTGEWYDAALWPIDAADYTLNPGTNALAGADVTAITTAATNSFTLQNPGNVSKTGYTALRLGLDGGQPAGDNYVQFASQEVGKPAQLVVTYTIP